MKSIGTRLRLVIPADAFAAGSVANKIVSSLCPGGKQRKRRSKAMIDSGRVDLIATITHRFPLDRIEQAYQPLASQGDGVLKIAIRP